MQGGACLGKNRTRTRNAPPLWGASALARQQFSRCEPVERRKDEIRCEIYRVEATIERDKQRLETLKKML